MASIEHISDGIAVMSALEQVPRWKTPTWTDLGFPVIDRGTHAIFPLALFHGATDDELERVEQEWSDTTRRLFLDGVHFYGGDFHHAEAELDTDIGYGRKLVAAGASPTSPLALWSIQNLGVILVSGFDSRAVQRTLALHVIPHEWARTPWGAGDTKRGASRARTMAREADAADATWSWPL